MPLNATLRVAWPPQNLPLGQVEGGSADRTGLTASRVEPHTPTMAISDFETFAQASESDSSKGLGLADSPGPD